MTWDAVFERIESVRHRVAGDSHLFFLPGAERVRLLRRVVIHDTRVRLRSILLTSGTTIVGLLPLLIQIERVPWKLPWLGVELSFRLEWLDTTNQDIWRNLALTSIGGLISSTVLIILVLPALYYASVRIGWVLRRTRLRLVSLVPGAVARAAAV